MLDDIDFKAASDVQVVGTRGDAYARGAGTRINLPDGPMRGYLWKHELR